MADFRGVAFPVHDSSSRIPVDLELLRVFVIMRAPDNHWLGSWPVSELKAAHVGGARFRVSIRQAKLLVEVENSRQFLDALEEAVESVEKEWFRGRFSALGGRSPRNAELSNPSRSISALKVEHPPTDPRFGGSTLDTATGPEKGRVLTHGLIADVEEYQLDVVQWLEAGMTAWFEFYFELGSQRGRERLEQAAAGLEKAALQLRSVSQELEMLEIYDENADLILAYARSVGTWASALEQIAVGCRMDQPAWALDGFTKMNEGTAVFEQILSSLPKSATPKIVGNGLSYLDAIVPESKVANRSVLLAKEPWRRALLAGGWSQERPSLRVTIWSTVLNFRNGTRALFSAYM